MSPSRDDPELQVLWERFHEVVNMPSPELRGFLLAEGSDQEGFPDRPDLSIPPLGREVLHILSKRMGDVTNDDVSVMQRVIAAVDRLHVVEPAARASDDAWRRALMRLGHDPLRER
jgi:hypothetical protein